MMKLSGSGDGLRRSRSINKRWFGLKQFIVLISLVFLVRQKLRGVSTVSEKSTPTTDIRRNVRQKLTGNAEKPVPVPVESKAKKDEVPFRRKGGENEEKLYGKIRNISILGERNTGTTWLYEHLSSCFQGDEKVVIDRHLTRYKHWFQAEDDRLAVKKNTLVISMYRNVYDWTRAMISTPHHAPNHMHLEWREYLSKPWTMERVGKDLELTDEQKNDPHYCQQKFAYKDVISCLVRPYVDKKFEKTHYSEHQPFYEMRNDGSGKPYDNILQLRKAKIDNFMSTENFKNVQDLWVVQYEDLLSIGTKELLDTISKLTGVEPKCDPCTSQTRKKRPIDPDMIEYLNEHVDWDAEKLIGYEKQEPPTIMEE